MKKAILCVLCLLLFIAFESLATGAEEESSKEPEEYLIRVSHVATQDWHPYNVATAKFDEVVNQLTGGKVTVKNYLGEKVPRELKLKDGADVKVDGDIITVTSSEKEIAGQVAADIEKLMRITNRDRRIFQDGIYIISKDGKEL